MMAYYSRSSNAYDFTLFEESFDSSVTMRAKANDRSETEDGGTQENRSKREDRRAEKDANIKRMRRRRSNIARIALGVIFGIAVAFIVASIIHGQVQLTELNQEISDAKAQLAEQQSVYTQLEMKVDSSISTTVALSLSFPSGVMVILNFVSLFSVFAPLLNSPMPVRPFRPRSRRVHSL